VKDVLAYARLLENPKDDSAFLRIANVPRRGVGAGSLSRLRDRATAAGTSVAEAARGDLPDLPKRAREGLAALADVLDRLRALPRSPLRPLFEAILAETGYEQALRESDDELERARAENLVELVGAADEADRLRPGEDLRAFLERASLVSDQDAWDPDAARVSLMTVHAAKGLEFERVVLAAAEDGVFPHERNLGSPEEVEEERRLFYVAMTRAKERLVVTHCAWRPSWQGAGTRKPSRFLDDVPDDLVTVVDRTGVAGAGTRRSDLAWSKGGGSWGVPIDSDQGEAVFEREAEALRPGDRVSHAAFGEGRVAALSGAGRNLRVTVDFDEAGTRTILWEYARLTRTGGGG
jgi:DNA helicase-2/ATP-dependent DNA helicase PcrA